MIHIYRGPLDEGHHSYPGNNKLQTLRYNVMTIFYIKIISCLQNLAVKHSTGGTVDTSTSIKRSHSAHDFAAFSTKLYIYNLCIIFSDLDNEPQPLIFGAVLYNDFIVVKFLHSAHITYVLDLLCIPRQ